MALRWLAMVNPKPVAPSAPIITTMFGEHATQVLRSAPMDDLRQTRFIVIDSGEDGMIFLHGFNRLGHELWDSWHDTIPDAKKQAVFSYGDDLGGWRLVPADVINAGAYGCELLAKPPSS